MQPDWNRLSNRPHVAKDTLSNFHFSACRGLCGRHRLHDPQPEKRFEHYLESYRGLKCESSNWSEEADRRIVKDGLSRPARGWKPADRRQPRQLGLLGTLRRLSLLYAITASLRRSQDRSVLQATGSIGNPFLLICSVPL
jgi:hypothetical protein